jgi:hypothetical protein
MSIKIENLYQIDINANFLSSHSFTTNLNIRSHSFFGRQTSRILRENLDKSELANTINVYVKNKENELRALKNPQIEKLIKNLEVINETYYTAADKNINSSILKLKSIVDKNKKIFENICLQYGSQICALTRHDNATPVILKRADDPQQLLQKIANQYTVDELYQEIGKKNGQSLIGKIYPEEILAKFRSGELTFDKQELIRIDNYRRSSAIRERLEHDLNKESLRLVFSSPWTNELFLVPEEKFESKARELTNSISQVLNEVSKTYPEEISKFRSGELAFDLKLGKWQILFPRF